MTHCKTNKNNCHFNDQAGISNSKSRRTLPRAKIPPKHTSNKCMQHHNQVTTKTRVTRKIAITFRLRLQASTVFNKNNFAICTINRAHYCILIVPVSFRLLEEYTLRKRKHTLNLTKIKDKMRR